MTMTLFAPSGTLRSRPTAMCERAVPRVDIIGCVAAVCAENSLHAGCHVAPCYKRDMSARQRRWNSGKQNTVLLRLVSGPGQHLAICPKCLRLSTSSHIVRYMSSKISQDRNSPLGRGRGWVSAFTLKNPPLPLPRRD